MACYYYNCLMCGEAFMEERAFHDNTVFCHNCQAYGSDHVMKEGRQVPQVVRVSFRCSDKIDWSKATKTDPALAFGRTVGIATKDQIAEYLDLTKDPYFAGNLGLTKLKLPVQTPPYNMVHYVEGDATEAMELVSEELKTEILPEGYAADFAEVGASYKATEKLLKMVRGE